MIPLRDTQPSYSTPFVTLAIIAVNVFAFLYQLSLDSYSLNWFISHYAIIPDRFQYGLDHIDVHAAAGCT